MIRRACVAGLASVVWGLAIACSSSGESKASDTDAGGGSTEDGAALQDGGTDASGDVDVAAVTCEGACKKTSLVATFGTVTRPLDRAQFGLMRTDAGTALYVEAHAGGKPECPSKASPSPDYTLVLSTVPRSSPNADASEGITGAFFDFKADFGLPPLVRAKKVAIHALTTDPAPSPKWTAFDVTVAFDEGSVTGHLYAEYCDSLSE